MRKTITVLGLSMLVAAVVVNALPGQNRRPGSGDKRPEKAEEPPPRPRDPKLVELHREFLSKTEKLAAEYEGKRELEKAREVYEAILRLMPEYDKAQQALGRITHDEATKDRKVVKVSAKKDWQDSGVVLQKGKPVHIEATGAWEMTMATGPDGIEIPKEYRDFKLGALVGVIHSGGDPQELKPFLIGSQRDFLSEETGRLFLRIYDADPRDNSGELAVVIQSTFGN